VTELQVCPVGPYKQRALEVRTITGRLDPVSRQAEVLTNRAETREKRLRARQVPQALHLTFTPTRGLVTVFRAVINPGRCLDEDRFHVG
jgi:hypothetical protein